MHTVVCFRTKVGSTGISATYPTILFGASSPAQPLLGPLESQKLPKMHRLHVGMPKKSKRCMKGPCKNVWGTLDIGLRFLRCLLLGRLRMVASQSLTKKSVTLLSCFSPKHLHFVWRDVTHRMILMTMLFHLKILKVGDDLYSHQEKSHLNTCLAQEIGLIHLYNLNQSYTCVFF